MEDSCTWISHYGIIYISFSLKVQIVQAKMNLCLSLTVCRVISMWNIKDGNIINQLLLHATVLGNSDHVVVSVSIDFPINSQQDAPFHCIAYDYSRAD